MSEKQAADSEPVQKKDAEQPKPEQKQQNEQKNEMEESGSAEEVSEQEKLPNPFIQFLRKLTTPAHKARFTSDDTFKLVFLVRTDLEMGKGKMCA